MDFSQLAAISGVDSWSDIRAGRANELRSIIMQEGLAQKSMDEQIAANQKIAEYQNILSTVSSKLLPPDVEKLKGHEEKLREDLKKKLKTDLIKAGGDVRKWMQGGGINDLNKYKQGLYMGEPTQQGLSNAFQYAQSVADEREGLILRDVDFTDKDGNVAKVPFKEQLTKFAKGELPTIKYSGAYPKIDFGDLREMYAKVEGKNPYQSEAIKPETVFLDAVAIAKKQGYSDEDAKKEARRYADTYKAGVESGQMQPFQFQTKQYNVSSAWGDQYASEMSAKYLVDAARAVGDPTNTQIWSEPAKGFRDSKGFLYTEEEIAQKAAIPGGLAKVGKLEPTTIQQADVLGRFDLGDETIMVSDPQTVYVDGKPTTKIGSKPVTIKNYLLPFTKDDKGNRYMNTYARQATGKPPLPFVSGSLDDLFSGVAKTPQVLKAMAAVKKVLDQEGLMTKGRPDLNKGQTTVTEKLYIVNGKAYKESALKEQGYDITTLQEYTP